MTGLVVVLTLLYALYLLGQGKWLPLVVFNVVGLTVGAAGIPTVFTALALLNVGYALLQSRTLAQTTAGRPTGHE